MSYSKQLMHQEGLIAEGKFYRDFFIFFFLNDLKKLQVVLYGKKNNTEN